MARQRENRSDELGSRIETPIRWTGQPGRYLGTYKFALAGVGGRWRL